MTLTNTISQAKQLLQATLEVPAEFWRGPSQGRDRVQTPDEVGVNTQAYPESDELGLKVTADEAKSKEGGEHGLVPIRSLGSRHRRLITTHLLALPAHDRYLRFGYAASDEQVQKYIDNLDFNRDEIYGIFNRRLQLIAMAHLAIASDPKCVSCAEFGVSVSAEARGKGLGTLLFKRAVLHARAQNIDMIFIHVLSENTAMLKIARKAGAVVESYGGEVEAHLRLPAQDLQDRVETAVKDAVADGIGEVDFRLKLRALQFWELLASLQEIRKTAQDGKHQSAE